jgi:hypothetical protein
VKQREPSALKGLSAANNPISYCLSMRDRFPNLSRIALDVLSIPTSSCNTERMFRELGDLLKPWRRAISPQLLAAIQCVRPWLKAGFKRADDRVAAAGDDDEIDRIYHVPEWDSNSEA